MTDSKLENKPGSRRTAVKGLALSTSALIASEAVPTNWAKPVVSSISLPVHAQTSGCGPLTAIDNDNASDLDTVVLSLVPGQGCEMNLTTSVNDVTDIEDAEGNVIVALDIGTGPPINWDAEVTGDTNWSVTPDFGSGNEQGGNFALTATRLAEPGAGNVYNVALSISIDGTPGTSSSMTVSANITQIS